MQYLFNNDMKLIILYKFNFKKILLEFEFAPKVYNSSLFLKSIL